MQGSNTSDIDTTADCNNGAVSPGTAKAPHIVIVGAGFGGLGCARALGRAPARITLIDQRNFHLFQPLLYQVATAALSPADIAMPIRHILRRSNHIDVVLGRVVAIDRRDRSVRLDKGGRRIAYDFLVIATGAVPSHAGHSDWAPCAPALKTIEDALVIRHRVLTAFEQAENTDDPVERAKRLTFVVVGGGPTGVEIAGAIAEFGRTVLPREFHRLRHEKLRVVVIEAGPQLLPAFPPPLARKARDALQDLGVEVWTDTSVEHCDADGIATADLAIGARTVVWAAGVTASEAARWLGVEPAHGGRVAVKPDLSLADDPSVFVIGDTALVMSHAKPVPGIASAAKQEGAYVAHLLLRRLRGQPAPKAFCYRNTGMLATIGRSSAVVDLGWIRLSGPVGWLVWAAAHILFLVGFRNRVMVALNWAWSYVTSEPGARLITGSGREH